MSAESDYAPALEEALRHALSHLGKAKNGPVGATATLAQLRARLGRPFVEKGTGPAQVIDDLVRDVEGGIVNSACGRFFGWVIGGTLSRGNGGGLADIGIGPKCGDSRPRACRSRHRRGCRRVAVDDRGDHALAQ